MHLLNLIAARFETAKFHGKDRGATAVEYGPLVGLIAVALIATVILLGTELNRLFAAVQTKLAAVVVP